MKRRGAGPVFGGRRLGAVVAALGLLGVVGLAAVGTGCKDDKEAEAEGPSAEQIEEAKKKLAAKKAAKAGDGKKAGAKSDKAADGKKADGKKADGKAATAGKDDDKAADPKDAAEERREKRKKRLAELKKRSEERRKKRLEALKKRREEAGKKGSTAAATPTPTAKPTGAKATPIAAKATPTPTTTVKPANPTMLGKAPTPTPTRPAAPAVTDAAPVAAEPATPSNALRISRYVDLKDVREITGKSALKEGGSVVGIPPSSRYNSVLFTMGKQGFGLAVQVWKETTQRASDQRFKRMQRDYPNAEDTDAVTTRGFFSSWGDMMTLVFFEPFKRTIIAVTCTTKVCTQQSLLELAKRVKAQM